MRRLRILPLLLVLAVVAPACSTFSKPPAATIDGREISTKALEDEIDAILGNKAFSGSLEQIYGFPATKGSVEGAFSTELAANVLTLRVWYDLIERDLRKTDETSLIDDAVETLRVDIPQQLESGLGEGTFSSFSDEFQERFVRDQAIVQALNTSAQNAVGDDAEAYYDEHPEEFAEICVSHVLVSSSTRTPEEAEDAANDLYDRIASGEDFEDVAANESDDPGAAAERGAIGCGSRSSLQFDPVFEAAAFALPLNEVSEPVQTQFGSHLILVTKRSVPDFDEIPDVESAMGDVVNRVFRERLMKVICGGDVSINSKYGEWVSDVCDDIAPASLPRVQPPEGPIGSEPSLTPGA